MSTKRIVKPTGWVVDMRHYFDEETGDRPGAIPNVCWGDNGLIHGWEDSPWDRQHDPGEASTDTSPGTTH